MRLFAHPLEASETSTTTRTCGTAETSTTSTCFGVLVILFRIVTTPSFQPVIHSLRGRGSSSFQEQEQEQGAETTTQDSLNLILRAITDDPTYPRTLNERKYTSSTFWRVAALRVWLEHTFLVLVRRRSILGARETEILHVEFDRRGSQTVARRCWKTSTLRRYSEGCARSRR